MASSSLVSTAMLSSPSLSHKREPSSDAFFKPMMLRSPKLILSASSNSKFDLGVRVHASMINEKAVTGLTAVALTAAMVIPDIADAAQPGVSPSLKNFLLSILSGGVVLGALVGAVIGVANFDPVKRT